MKSIIISTFGGLGKTTFAKDHPDLAIDIEGIPYKYIYKNISHEDLLEADHEKYKGVPDRNINPQFPHNYVAKIRESIGKYKFILIVLAPDVLTELDRLGLEYIILYPNLNDKDVILDRLKKRGNNEAFIKKIDNILSNSDELEYIKARLRPKRLIELGRNEYVGDWIKKYLSKS